MSIKEKNGSPLAGCQPQGYDEAEAQHRYQGVYGSQERFLGVAGADLEDPASYRQADAVILGAPFDGGASYRPGSRFGPRAIRLTDYLPAIPYRPHLTLGLDPFSFLKIVDAGDLLLDPGNIQETMQQIEQAVAKIAQAMAVPIVLGGDHSISLANMEGLARQLGKGSFGLIHFDAHADIGDRSDFGSPLGHGTPMRRAIESGAIRGHQVIQIGLRGYWPGPASSRWAQEQGIRWQTMDDIARKGLQACLDEIVEEARSWPAAFLSVDIDVVDPGMAPGTGTPEPGGLTSRQLLESLRRCAMDLPIRGFDLVEVSPPYDNPGQTTALLANRAVLEVLSGIAAKQHGSRGSGSHAKTQRRKSQIGKG